MRPCPVCGGFERVILHHHTLKLPDQIDIPEFDVVECSLCHMVFNDSYVKSEQLARYYTAPWYSSTREYRDDDSRFADIAEYLEARLPLTERVLEIGSAGGGLLEQLKARGFDNCVGVNLGSEPPTGQFDLIIVNQVLEHVLDVCGFIANARKLLAPGGSLYIDVPDTDNYLAHAHESFSYFNFEHVNHFTFRSLIALLGLPDDFGRSLPEIVPGYFVPLMHGLWSFQAKRNVPKYVEQSRVAEQELVTRILAKLNGRTKVFVRGYSHRAWHVLSLPELAHLEVLGFIDSAPHMQRLTVEGKPVLSSGDFVTDYPVILLADSSFVTGQMQKEYADENEVIF